MKKQDRSIPSILAVFLVDLDGVDGALVVAALLAELARVGDALDDGGGDLRHAVDLRTKEEEEGRARCHVRE